MRAAFLIALLLAGCAQAPEGGADVREVTLTTADGWLIKGTFYNASSEKGVILLHMLRRDRSTYRELALALQKAGYRSIAIDLRGHGGSTNKGTWEAFGETDFNSMVEDVRAAKEFLASQGARTFALIGASIGANTALAYAVGDSDVKAAVLLSPGLDYRGVKTEKAAGRAVIPLLIAASDEDEYSFISAQRLAQLASASELRTFSGAGHGTDMLAKTNLTQEIIRWLDRRL
ncbi:MAG: alpha/beta fold hydrolase [Candidatus Micrarchaeia archaeon]